MRIRTTNPAGGLRASARPASASRPGMNSINPMNRSRCARYQPEGSSIMMAICSAGTMLSRGCRRSPIAMKSGPMTRLAAAVSVR